MKRIWKTIPSKSKKWEDTHSISLVFTNEGEFIVEASNCTCDWGSCWRWAKNNPTEMCDHIRQALEIHDKENTDNFNKIVKENENG